MIKISNRLESLVKYVNPLDQVIDVGCDHALLDIFLVQSKIVNHIYVSDVNQNALDNGKNNIEKYELQNNITPVLSYGIEKINNFDVDTIIISGMGSKTIIDILSSPNLNKIYKLILQSNNNYGDLRRFLKEKNYKIIEEEIVKDGKKTYINIIALKSKIMFDYDAKELEFGPILIKNAQNIDYFKEVLGSYERIAYASGNDELKEKVKMLEEIIEDLSD